MAEPSEAEVQESLRNAIRLIEACRNVKKPIIMVTTNPFLGTMVKTRCDNPMFPPGTDLVQKEADMRSQGWFDLAPGLDPTILDVEIVKPNWDAFFQTTLHADLQRLGVTQILLCGLATSEDVEITAISASERGYNLALPLDAMADADTEGSSDSKTKKLPKVGQTGKTESLISLIH